MKTITILTGAGISAESGIKTFRDSNGLWENHSVEDVASPKGFLLNPGLVLEFYNQRRAQLKEVEPNEGHKQLVRLEEKYKVNLVTQNVDDLHERAGSTNILHLHGKLTEVKSSGNDKTIKDIGYNDIKLGDLCEEGFQMRPNIVWFGETVPLFFEAEGLTWDCDIFIVVGTSLNVYPAASLFKRVRPGAKIYYIDPNPAIVQGVKLEIIQKPATEGVKELVDKLLSEA